MPLGNARNIAFWVVLFLMILALFNAFGGDGAQMNSTQISYSDFIRRVDDGQVASATIDGETVVVVGKDGKRYVTVRPLGEDLADLIRNEDSTARLWLARAAAADLAAFHVRGMWHGGAQIRNVTLRDGELWRIDFEENIGSTLSRPLAQAYDLFQMLASLASLRKLPDDDARTLGKLALQVYFEHNPDPEVRARLTRLARLLCSIAAPLRAVLARLPSRDVQGFFRVADILQPLLLKP